MAIINGTTGNDVITGTSTADFIYGQEGNDRINGGAGDDTIEGGIGADTLTGDAGNDVLYGGAGNDGFFGGGGNDIIYGQADNDTLYGDAGNDDLYGGEGNDVLFGGAGHDFLFGGSGTNVIHGGSGHDVVFVELTSSQVTQLVIDDFMTLLGVMEDRFASAGSMAALEAQTTGTSVTLTSLGLTLDTWEEVKVILNGQEINIEDLFNHAPETDASSSISTNEDTAISGEVTATDSDGDALTWSMLEGPSNGTLTLNTATGGYTYSPNANFNGSDSFRVAVMDGKGGLAEQIVNVGVAAVNDAPVAETNANAAADEDTPVSGQIVATDIDGDVLGYALATGPVNGTVTVDASTGAYTYTPAPNFNGTDSFQVVIADPSGASVVQTVSVAVAPENDTPETAAQTAVTVDEDKSVSGQVIATDVDGDVLGYAVATGPAHGAVTIDSSTGAYTYVPSANFNGTDSFQVVVADPSGASVIQNVSVTVTPQNDVPVADAQSAAATDEDTPVSGQVIATDIDGDVLGYAVATGPANGTVTIDASTGAYTYTPAPNFNGADSFQVSIADPSGASVIQTVSVSIAPENDTPETVASVTVAVEEDKSVSGQVAATDVDGDTLSWTMSADPANGVVTLNTDTGEYTYKPAANFSGSDFFDVTVADASGASAVQRVTVTVSAVADVPSLSVVNPVIVPAGVVLAGLNSPETLTGGAGSDTISGNSGDDTLDGNGSTTITVGLDIAAALQDLDGSESLLIQIGNLPEGAVLSAGYQTESGAWALTVAELAGLKVTASVTASFTVDVTAYATESSNGSVAVANASIDVILSPDANFMSGGAGNDTMTGGTGNDTMYGNSGNDTMSGGAGNDKMYGGKNNDTLAGGEGDDILNGNSGDDVILGDAGNDTLTGGSGFDTLDYSSALGAINADLSKKTITGAATGTDTISGSNFELIVGSSFADTFKGSSSADRIDGGAGNDWLRGLGGADNLTGGAGSDTYFWEKTDVGATLGVDRIKDFGAGDVLDFRKLVGVGTKPLSGFVKVTDGAEGSTISAKVNGSFVDVAMLEGVHGTSATELLANGHLLVG